MKKYPKVNGKELSVEQKQLFDIIEDIILRNSKVLEGTKVQTIDVIAYNSAFSILTNNELKINKL